eukprot:scaffold310064_cov33-Tisochrysis_lutea.AAC.2
MAGGQGPGEWGCRKFLLRFSESTAACAVRTLENIKRFSSAYSSGKARRKVEQQEKVYFSRRGARDAKRLFAPKRSRVDER